MSEPLGRDRLGRLVYEGDTVKYGRKTWKAGTTQDRKPFLLFDDVNWFGIPARAECCEVDLEASPKRSNFERYFADLGTFDAVEHAYSFGCDYNCENCPFDSWGKATDSKSKFTTCLAFWDWLDEVALA